MVANVAAFDFAGLLSNIGTEVKKSFSFFFFFKEKAWEDNQIWSSRVFHQGWIKARPRPYVNQDEGAI